VKSPESNR